MNIFRTISAGATLIAGLAASSTAVAICPPGEPIACCDNPPIPAADACEMNTFEDYDLSTVPSPNAKQFSITARHAVWADYNASSYRLYYVAHNSMCSSAPAAAATINGTTTVETADASIKIGTSSSRVYFDRSGGFTNLEGIDIPGMTPVTLLPAAPSDRRAPGSTEGGASPGFVWEQGGDIYACLLATCTAAQIIRVTNTAQIERLPRIAKNFRATWQNNTTGQIQYADLNVTPIAVNTVDSGFIPDINNDWIVYSKWEANPVAGCDWTQHSQIWSYGPLSGAPIARRVSAAAVSNLGAANYIAVRLTDNYLLTAINFIYESKTVLALTKVDSFDLNPAAPEFREILEDADAYGVNVDIFENTATDQVFTVYRSHQTHGAKLGCCTSAY